MEKDMRVALLLDLYQKALTPKQADALDYYFNQDLSLSEIGEHLGISRQGVRDLVQRGQSKLWELDGEFGLMGRTLRQSKELREAKQMLLALQKTCGHEKELAAVCEILDRWSDLDGLE